MSPKDFYCLQDFQDVEWRARHVKIDEIVALCDRFIDRRRIVHLPAFGTQVAHKRQVELLEIRGV